MNRTSKTALALTIILSSGLQLNAGGGKSAAIGIGSGMAGFMLGTAVASQNNCNSYDCGYDAPRYVERETVYVQQPARTVTVQCPYLQRDLRNAQDQLAREQSKRRSLESRVAQLEASLTRSERTNDYLASENAKLENEINELKAPKVTTVVTTGHSCSSQSCALKKTGTPGMNRVVDVVDVTTPKEQY